MDEQKRCSFVDPKNKKRCALKAPGNESLCSMHTTNPRRVPCPYDNNHTVWTSSLNAHLKKCPKRPIKPSDPWFNENINCETVSQDTKKKENFLPIQTHEYFYWIRLINNIEDLIMTLNPIKNYSSNNHYTPHNALQDRLKEVSNPKHALQQSSLIYLMETVGLYNVDSFVEFGCGRAELSRFTYLATMKKKEDNSHVNGIKNIILVDRDSPRLKHDSRIIKDSKKENCLPPNIYRLKVDIKNLDISKLQDKNKDNMNILDNGYIAISKHLCGAATDLTISCISHSSTCIGIVIALCCRHRCDFHSLHHESKRWLESIGINPRGFFIISRMCSWAVDGSKSTKEIFSESDMCSDEKDVNSLEMNKEERQKIGDLCRRIIDYSRIISLNSLGYNAQIVEYISKEATLENYAIVASK